MQIARNQKYANTIPMKEIDSDQKLLNPFPTLNELRKRTPVRYDPDRQCWDIFRYEDVQRVLKDPQTFSSRRGMEMRSQENLLVMDPPRHTRMRELVNKAFTPKAILELEPRIRSIAQELIEDVIHQEEMDIVHDFATPLPVIVIAELLGVSTEDRSLFKHWSDVLVKGAEDNTDEAFAKMLQERKQTQQELASYFRKIIELRRENPKNDLISALLQAEIDGQKLTDEEVIGFAILLLVAGNETTTNLITNTVHRLIEEPSLQERLKQYPKLIPSTIEEVLRFYPPVKAIGRVAAKDTVIGGETIKAGDQVICWVAAANRDEKKFPEPDQFIADRKPNPHLAFGFGIHFCLGAPLARLEGKVALEIMMERLTDLDLVPNTSLKPIDSPFVYGFKQYPITFKTRRPTP